ncbi:7-deoxyloganetin glucosyltransferase-like [Diospyros lotus]|uniref:7-deoxyloganetin glucosyltransferase-like n=1 Tax=Diospyros lotus TaxID=55363 RepID=UPI002250C82B|nr:7-deoxyloganetin glucosyltransferase-like [Diospyros lotus]
MASTTTTDSKPHAVCIPYPLQGHVKPMLKLAQLLHSLGFYITFVNTDFIHDRLLKAASITCFADFRFESFPDGLPPCSDDSSQDGYLLSEACHSNFLDPLRSLVARLGSRHGDISCPPVTCIIADGMMPFTITIAEQIGVPGMLLWPTSVCAFMALKYHHLLKEKELVPVPEGQLDSIVEWIPGLKDVRVRDLPLVHAPNGLSPMREAAQAFKASGIIFNSFNTLEQDLLDAISSMYPSVYAIGPLQMLLNSTSSGGEHPESVIGSSSIWKEEAQCLQWLHSKEPNSVVYISFGSRVTMTQQQLLEFAWGICNSNYPFLWVIRPDLVKGRSARLPPELLETIEGRGFIVSWCPQEQVLDHPSVRVFITHCGWNSTVESISAGMPMICWPCHCDQPINCRYSCRKWGIGMEMGNGIERDAVEKLVREVMERGEKLKQRAVEWKKLAEEATSGNSGSSSMNLKKLVEALLG